MLPHQKLFPTVQFHIMRYTFCLPIAFLAFLMQVLGHSLQPRAPQSDLAPLPVPSCTQNLVINQKLWADWNMNDYMKYFPDIDKITLTEFARKVGAPNFFCGLGKNCPAEQNCVAAVDRDWLFLVAVQRWNSNLNNLHAAINTACDIVKTVSSSIVKDFLADTHMEKGMIGWAIATLVIGILAGVIGPLVPLFAPKSLPQIVGAYRSEASLSVAAASYANARAAINSGDLVKAAHIMEARDVEVITRGVKGAQSKVHPLPPFKPNHAASPTHPGTTTHPVTTTGGTSATFIPPHQKRSNLPFNYLGYSKNLTRRGKLEKRKAPPSAYAFDTYGALQTNLAGLQARLLNLVEAMSDLGNNSPIWSIDGLAGSLYDGEILADLPTQIQNQENAIQFAKLTVLSDFMISQNHFITLDCDPCNSKGAGGAWPEDKYLSYCTPEGSMRNIIRAQGIHARNEFKNPGTLITNYFSVKELTDRALACQGKYGFYTGHKFPEPQNITSECVFTVPVCDCKLDAVRHQRKKKKGTVRGCRAAGVPI